MVVPEFTAVRRSPDDQRACPQESAVRTLGATHPARRLAGPPGCTSRRRVAVRAKGSGGRRVVSERRVGCRPVVFPMRRSRRTVSRLPGVPFSPFFPTLPGVSPPPALDVDHALAPVRPAMTRPSVLQAVRAQVAVHVEVLVSALQHLADAVRGGLDSFDCLPLEHPYERAQVTPVRLPAGRRSTSASPAR